MAIKVWTGATDTAWSTSGNWSPSGAPSNGDTVIFDASMVRSLAGSDQSATTLARLIVYTSASNSYSIGSAASPLIVGASVADIHYPDPGGSTATGLALVSINFGTAATVCTVYGGPNTGSNGKSPVLLAGVEAGNALYVKGGVVGLGTMSEGQASTFPVVVATGGTLNLGSNLTLTAVTNKGARVNCASEIPTLHQYSETTTLTGTAKVSTALNVYGGNVVVNGRPASGATIATCNLRGGTIDCSADLRALTISTLSLGDGTLKTGTSGASQLTVTTTSLYWGDQSGRTSNLTK